MKGTDQISIPANAVLKFSYPAIPDPLYIHSGANSIKWSYILNTASTPTIGGEVIQILSATVGPITITGQTAGLKTNKRDRLPVDRTQGWADGDGKRAFTPNHELRNIVAWFRKYMTLAGTDNAGNAFRNERAIYFEYPERGWNFQIMPTALQGFRYDKKVISPEWSITAEVVSNNALDYFSGVTMSSFTDDLLATNAQLQGQIGLSHFGQTGTETSNPNFGQTGDFGSTNPFLNPELGPSALAAVKRMGDNFQGLVAAWSTGDFAHFGFGAMLDNGSLPKNVDAVYQKLFGNTFLGSLPGWGSGGSSTGGGTHAYTSSNQQDGVAVQIANAWSAKNMPPELGLAVAWIESKFSPTAANRYPDDVGPNGHIGLFQEAVYRGPAVMPQAAIAFFEQHKNELPADGSPGSLKDLTSAFPVATQVSLAAGWFKSTGNKLGFDGSTTDEPNLFTWATTAQGGGYTAPQFHTALAKARSILKKLSSSSTKGLTSPFPGGWIPNRLDQGYDGTFSGNLVAPFAGTITQANTHDPGWKGGSIVLKADQKQPALPTKSLYFAEGVLPTVVVGDRVAAGDKIGVGQPSGPWNGVMNQAGTIEWGPAVDDSNTVPYAQVASNPRQMVLDFAKWAETALGVGAPTDTSGAGYP